MLAHRHIAAPRVERPDRSTMTLAARGGKQGQPRNGGAGVQRARPEGHDAALSHVQNHAQPVTITRLNGSQITGIIVRRDRFTVTMERSVGNNTVVHSIIYKHAIDTIDLPEFNKSEVK